MPIVSYLYSIIETLRKGELITEDEVLQLCTIGREILAEEGNIQRVDAPVTVLYLFYLSYLQDV